jgi:N-acetylmuramoyl-L-alanine amidase
MIEIQNGTQNVKYPKVISLMIFVALIVILTPASARAATPAPVTITVDGRVLESPVPPIIVQDRTLVAVRFVSEALGARVEWVPEGRQVIITQGPDTIILAVGKADAQVSDKTVSLEVAPQIVDDRAMVPLRFIAEALGATVEWEPETRTVNIRSNPLNITQFSAHQDGRIATLDISTTRELAYSTFQLDNPPRAVFDFAGAHLAAGVPETVPIASPYIQQIRSADKSDGVRVVLDLTANLPHDVVRTDGGLQIRFVPRIQAVRAEKLDGKTRLTIAGNLPLDATVTAPAGQNKLVINVPQARSDLKENVIRLADGTINSISVAQGATPSATVITVSLPYYLGHTVLSKAGDSSIVVDLVTSPVLGKRIWIDAGHGQVPGGKDDPGSIGKFFKTVEKLVNLQVALELQQQLKAAGATVYMTRTGDAGADFTARPAMVNALNPPADLFVSIHHNSAADATVRGTETYYWTTNPRSRPAALAIHAGVLRSLGFPDRRVRTEAFYVIKETRAPAVLVELGYLSNQAEEAAIAEPGAARKTYPARAAEGIKNGILDFFWQDIRSAVAN